MSDDGNKKVDQINKGFEIALNRQGYVFQHTLLVHILSLTGQGKTTWYIPVMEFPVNSQGYGTRIDLVIKHTSRDLYLIAECKRVNPALSNWVFAKSTHLPRGPYAYSSYYEVFTRGPDSRVSSSVEVLEPSERIYHIGVEVKSNSKGDAFGSKGRGEIEDACGQVCRALNGFGNFLAFHSEILKAGSSIGAIPVIFTTANLWVSNVDLGAGDLSSGTLKTDDELLENMSWIFYHYNQSPGLKHGLAHSTKEKDLLDAQYQEFTRPIAIVSSSGVEEFLRSGIWI